MPFCRKRKPFPCHNIASSFLEQSELTIKCNTCMPAPLDTPRGAEITAGEKKKNPTACSFHRFNIYRIQLWSALNRGCVGCVPNSNGGLTGAVKNVSYSENVTYAVFSHYILFGTSPSTSNECLPIFNLCFFSWDHYIIHHICGFSVRFKDVTFRLKTNKCN